MQFVIVNSRGRITPNRIRKGENDDFTINFDFDLFFEDDQDSVKTAESRTNGNIVIASTTVIGNRVQVSITGGGRFESTDLIVKMTGANEVKEVSLYIDVSDLERTHPDLTSDYGFRC